MPTVSTRTLIDQYLASRGAHLRLASRASYRSDLLQLSTAFRDRSLFSLTTGELGLWLQQRTREPGQSRGEDPRPWSRRSAVRKRGALVGFYKWAVKEGLGVKNPAADLEIGRFDTADPVRFDADVVTAIFARMDAEFVAGPRRGTRTVATPASPSPLSPIPDEAENRWRGLVLDRAVLRCCYSLAMRVGEPLGLRMSRIHVVDGIRVADVTVKGGKTARFPFTGAVGAALDDWLALRPEPADAASQDFVFLSPYSRRPVNRRRIWESLRHHATRAGLPADLVAMLSPHKLRHAKAFHLVAAGKPVTDVQGILGHASLDTTMIYVRNDAQRRLNSLIAYSQSAPTVPMGS